MFCGEKTTSAPGQTTKSLSEGISGRGLGATSRSWNEEPAGVLAPGVLSPSGLSIPPRTRTISTRTQHSPKDYCSSPKTQHLPHTTPPPSQTRATFPRAQHSPGDHSISSRTTASLQNHSTPHQGPQHPVKDQQRSGVAVKLLSPTNTPHPIGTHRHIPETCRGDVQPWSRHILVGQQVRGPTTRAGRMPAGMAGQGVVPGPRDWERAARGGCGGGGVWERCLRKPAGFSGLHAKSPSQKGPVRADRMLVAQPHLFGQQSLAD